MLAIVIAPGNPGLFPMVIGDQIRDRLGDLLDALLQRSGELEIIDLHHLGLSCALRNSVAVINIIVFRMVSSRKCRILLSE